MNVILNKNRLYPLIPYIPAVSSYNTVYSSTETSNIISARALQYWSHTMYRPQAVDGFIMDIRWTNTERDSSVITVTMLQAGRPDQFSIGHTS